MTNTGAQAKSSGEAILLEDALHKAVTKHDQCQKEAVTTEELILPSPGHSVTLWVLQLLSLFSTFLPHSFCVNILPI